MENGEYSLESGEVLLDIAKLEYQNEFSRTSMIDSKVGIALPIVATYFFLVVQHASIQTLFSSCPNNSSILAFICSVLSPISYVVAVILAGLALFSLFKTITTHSYHTIDVRCFNDPTKISYKKHQFASVMVTYFIRAMEHNRVQNNLRVDLYKRGWKSAILSLATFVLYIILVG